MRFTYRHYLRSEHWQNLRLEKLAKVSALCHFCRFESTSNDVHHVIYRASLRETKLRDLRVLCRRCHDLVHQVLKEFPAIKKEEHTKSQWRICEQHVRRRLGQKISIPKEAMLVKQSDMALASSRLKQARHRIPVPRADTPLTEHVAHWFRTHLDCTDEAILRRAARHAGINAIQRLEEILPVST